MKSELGTLYNDLYSNSVIKISEGNYSIDALINDASDKRMGITLLLRPSKEVINNIHRFLGDVFEIEPDQYFYPESDLHVTVLSVISCVDGFDIKNINVTEYIGLIEEELNNIKPFNIEFRGVTLSDSCVLIQGFPDIILNNLRDKLRLCFKNSSLYNSIDTRYKLKSAHSTVLRFKNHLKNTKSFIELINRYRDFNFGSTRVYSLELVYNDWYQRVEKTHLIKKIRL